MDWITVAQISALMIVGSICVNTSIGYAIKEWSKYKRGVPL